MATTPVQVMQLKIFFIGYFDHQGAAQKLNGYQKVSNYVLMVQCVQQVVATVSHWLVLRIKDFNLLERNSLWYGDGAISHSPFA